jgi:signal transduction histidine kinase/ligand-binding sensor domain-containing protein
LTVAIAATWFVISTDAADGERALSQYVRDLWGSDTGFPGGPVYAITQTDDGYLWIGAEKGLVRFDGLTFRLLEPFGSPASAGSTVFGVAAAADGSLWARLRGIALVRYHDGAFEDILAGVGAPDSVVSAMVRGRGDRMLLATLGQGAIAYEGGRFATIASPKAMPSSSFVISIAETGDGDIWLGTRDAGLLRVQGSRVTRLTDRLPDFKINCLLATGNGELWIGTDKGVVRWTGVEITRSGIPIALHDIPALAMIRDGHSNVWIAAGPRGLLRVSRQGTASSAERGGRSGRHVTALFEDRDRNVWVGTDQGLERWRDPVFTTYSIAQGLPSEGVGPVYVDPAERIWFAPSSGGLYRMHDGVVVPIKKAGLDRDVVYSIDGGNDEIWLGRQRGGLTRLRLRGTTVTAERFTHADGLAQDSVYAVHRARDGAIWAGTLSAGASRFKDGVFTTYGMANGLASNTVTGILETSDGTMWFATPNGLSALSGGGWRTYAAKDGLPSNDVNTIFQDPVGNVWVGTAGGLAVIQAGHVRPLRNLPSALRRPIVGLSEDRGGSLWLATADRIAHVNRPGLLQGILSDGDVREYGLADGLVVTEGLKRHRTVVSDSRGRIWFALNRGLSVADPARDTDGRALPALTHVEEMSADGRQVDLKNPIKIPSDRRRVALAYAGLSLSVPERVRFRYRLDGFDRDWSEPVAARQAVYTNLGPGHYRFRVTASNSDGLWNGAEATLPFEIQPMFWQTAWFRMSAVLLGFAAGWGLYRLRVLQVARQLNLRFEERLAERTRIAQELHDTLLQGFMSASMQLHVAVDRLPDESPARSSLSRVLDLMGRVIEEGRNAVRGLRSSTSESHSLEQAFSGMQQELAVAEPAAYRVVVQGKPRPLKPIIRDEVYRIGREGVVNAFRHSGAANIEIELEYRPRELRMFVRDDGRGVDPAVVQSGTDGHWGITGMRERAERIGASLKMRSRAAAGTEIELRVPAHVAFGREVAARPEPPAPPSTDGASGGQPDIANGLNAATVRLKPDTTERFETDSREIPRDRQSQDSRVQRR